MLSFRYKHSILITQNVSSDTKQTIVLVIIFVDNKKSLICKVNDLAFIKILINYVLYQRITYKIRYQLLKGAIF